MSVFHNQPEEHEAERESFLKRSQKALGEAYDMVKSAGRISLSQLAQEKAALVIVDMVNGFVKEGALASSNALAINDRIAALSGACAKAGIPIAALCDSHSTESPEFGAFPVHCIADSAESQVTDEIASACTYTRIPKNSISSIIEPAFIQWVENSGADTFIIVGVCTDICVLNLACGLKAQFNNINKTSRIVVPTDMTATYDGGDHDAELCGVMANYFMSVCGAELCSGIDY